MYRKSIDMSRSHVTGGKFGVSTEQLRELMDARGADGLQRLQEEFGTVEDVCQRLHSHPIEGKYLMNVLDIRIFGLLLLKPLRYRIQL